MNVKNDLALFRPQSLIFFLCLY